MQDCLSPMLSQTQSFSFGVSRDKMKKLHIDDINTQQAKDPSPGPGQHESAKKFGVKGNHWTMNKRQRHLDYVARTMSTLPGPGHYKHTDIVGNSMTNSKIRTGVSTSFGKAHDRWKAATEKVKSPAPVNYGQTAEAYVKTSSTLTKTGRTVFGRDRTDALNKAWNLRTDLPGPGEYNRFSDFKGLEQPKN